MKTTILFRTEDYNYSYNHEKMLFHYLHPLVNFFYTNQIENDLPFELRKSLHNLFPEYSNEQINYYFKKYKYLKKAGILSNLTHNSSTFVRLTGDSIKNSVANTNQVCFEVTNKCNLKCKYCGYGEFYDFYDERKGTNLDFDKAKQLLLYLIDLWRSSRNASYNKNIYIGFYGGEPLLNFSFIKKTVDFINAQHHQQIRFTFSMTTNGVLLEKHIDFLVKNNFKLLISLDGTKKNDSYRVFKNGKNSYDLVYKNILLIKNKYEKYFIKNVNFNAVLHNRNSVSEISNYFINTFHKKPRIGELTSMGISKDNEDEFYRTYVNFSEDLGQAEDYNYLTKTMFSHLPNIQSHTSFLHQHLQNVYKNHSHFFHERSSEQFLPTGTCMPFSRKIFLTTNGKILFCERIPHEFSFGNVDNNVNLNYDIIAEQINSFYDTLSNQCNNCYNSHNCLQCMYLLDSLKENPKCKGFTNEANYKKYLSDCIHTFEKQPSLYYKIMNKVTIQ